MKSAWIRFYNSETRADKRLGYAVLFSVTVVVFSMLS